MKKTILVCTAHPDDEIFGVGGTIAAYAQKGYAVHVLIFSYGEKGNVWLKKSETKKIRMQESLQASKIVCSTKVDFFGLEEGLFREEAKRKNIEKLLTQKIQKIQPEKIFTHAPDDPHPDHNTTFTIVLQIVKKIKKKYDVYSFDIWTPVNLKKRNLPRLYVDTTDTFQKKIQALKCFRSQKSSLLALLWSVYVRAIKAGFEHNTRFAEVFYKTY